MSLATTWRPQKFSDVAGQELTIKTLQKLISTNSISNCILLAGPSGVGKTTLARIIANEINNGIGTPIEIDAASNNGVDNVREIIERANERAIDGSIYKVFIIDECHQITSAGWNAFLKCTEEPPKYTIFIFCTTEPNKIPATVRTRLMKFNLNKVSEHDMYSRLFTIAANTLGGVDIDPEALTLICKQSNGCMREAIAMLEKVEGSMNLGVDKLTVDLVKNVLGKSTTDTMLDTIDGIFDKNIQVVISNIESSTDLKSFIDQLLITALDLSKYVLFRNFDLINISPVYIERIKYSTGIRQNANEIIDIYSELIEDLFEIKREIRTEPLVKETVEAMMLNIIRTGSWNEVC